MNAQLSRYDRVLNWFKCDVPVEKRWSSTYVINMVCIIWLVGYFAITGFTHYFKLGLTFHDVKCLDGTGYFIFKSRPDELIKGEKYAYSSFGLKPLLADGSTVIKIAAGLPGDKVTVNDQGVFINDKKWGDLNPVVLQKTKRTVQSVTREFVVGKDEVLMMGTLPRSYDGRYTGPVRRTQLTGRAWKLW